MLAQDFYNLIYSTARDIGAEHIQAAIAAAQSGIETGWGKHVKNNAYFGLKVGDTWKGKTTTFTTHEFSKGQKVKIRDNFRAYDSINDSVRNYLETIKTTWPETYRAKSLSSAAKGLERGRYGRYATDPLYAEKVRKTAQKRANKAKNAYEIKKVNADTPKQIKANPKSNILPLFRPKQTDMVTKAILAEFSSLMPRERRLDDVKILVVRGYFENSMGRKGVNDRGLYDDAVFVATPDGVQPFNGNSDPSVFRKRVASIKAKKAIRYRPGLHGYKRRGGPYPAFRQDADCTVIRDGVGEDTGMFNVNLHRGGVNGTSSLGCLTIPPHQWDEFYGLITGLLKKYNQDTFYVTLLEYAGGNPPVHVLIPSNQPSFSPKKTTGAFATAFVATAVLIASWWDQITTWIGGVLP